MLLTEGVESTGNTKKGEYEAPRNQLTLCCHVQSTDPRAKIRNIFVAPREKLNFSTPKDEFFKVLP